MSYSGNLVAYTTTKVSQDDAMLYLVDIRDPHQLVDPSNNTHNAATEVDSFGHVNLSFTTSRCVFTHLDDMIVVGMFSLYLS